MKFYTTQKRVDLLEKMNEIVRLYQSGKTAYELSVMFNCSKSWMIVHLKKVGKIKLRPAKHRSHIIPWNKNKPYYHIRGDKNPNWKGGITNLNQRVRHCIQYKNWLRDILKRDNWTCVVCGKRGGDMEVDHYPKMFHEIMSEYQILSFEDAERCSELWNLANGRTVCLKCHDRKGRIRPRLRPWCNKE